VADTHAGTPERIVPQSPERTLEVIEEHRPPVHFDEKRAQVHVYRILAHNPELLATWMPLCDFFMNSTQIEAYDREVIILRTGKHCGSDYEWAKHIVKTEAVGLSDADVEAIKDLDGRPGDGSWLDTLLTMADELHTTATITDDTLARLRTRYDDGQVLAALMMAGEYHMLAYAINGAGIVLEA
jgi:4-carboxymuconolactone decarboxylase